MITPSRARIAGGISRRRSSTGWSLPSMPPAAMRNRTGYPIGPAAVVTASRTGCFNSSRRWPAWSVRARTACCRGRLVAARWYHRPLQASGPMFHVKHRGRGPARGRVGTSGAVPEQFEEPLQLVLAVEVELDLAALAAGDAYPGPRVPRSEE